MFILIIVLFWFFTILDVSINEENDFTAIHGLHVSNRPPFPQYARQYVRDTNRTIRSVFNSTIVDSLLCKAHHNIQVLFFNRIAKCASTSFVGLLRGLSEVGGFDVLISRRGAYDWTPKEVVVVTETIKKISRGKRVAYAQHFYYTDFSPRLRNYGYVTLVREPIERMVSSFNYYHYSTKEYIKRMLPKIRRNETLLDCVQMEHDGCKHNLMTKYFCGHSQYCSTGSNRALEVAKHNLRNNFIAVGLVENLTLSVQLFQKLIPTFFPPMPITKLNKLLPYTNQNKRMAMPDSQTVKAIEIRNQADIELYHYAKDLFFRRLASCNM